MCEAHLALVAASFCSCVAALPAGAAGNVVRESPWMLESQREAEACHASLLQTQSQVQVQWQSGGGASLLERGEEAEDVQRVNADSEQPMLPSIPISEMAPAVRTPGGGLEGGFNGAVALQAGLPELATQPAPPERFPSGCQWQNPRRLALVHIGRSAGTSIRGILRRAPVNFTHDHSRFHQQYFHPADYDLFLVATRDPVSRVVSAFNWRHPVGGGPVSGLHVAEQELYACFPDLPGGVNRFAESLNDETACGEAARRCLHSASAECNHLSWNIRYYTSTGLRDREQDLIGLLRNRANSNASKSVFMISQSANLVSQMASFFDWLCVPPQMRHLTDTHSNDEYQRQNDTYLSERGRQLLTNHLAGDYFAMDELAQYAVGH